MYPSLTSEIYIIPIEGAKWIIYAPLRRAAFIGNINVVNFLADLKIGNCNKNLDPKGLFIEFLRRLEIVESPQEVLPIKDFSGQPVPTSVTLFLTTACNLRCSYCYAMAGDTPRQYMKLDAAKKGVDFVANNAKNSGLNSFEIYYHGGGEPTLNWEVMTKSLEYAKIKAKELNLEVKAYSALNGVLSNKKIDWIIKNLNASSLSFDGLPEVHDTHRKTLKGKDSSKEVMHTLKRFDMAGFNYGLRLTVTKDQIPKLVDSISFICNNFKPKKIQVEPAYQLGRWKDAPSAETEEFITMFKKAQVVAKKHNFYIYFSTARLGILTNHFCGLSQDNFSLSPKGNVSACYEVFHEENELASTFFYGNQNKNGQGYIFDMLILDNLRKQAVNNRKYCADCFAKWTCAGDCYHKSLKLTGKKEFNGSERCHITQVLTKDQILDKIMESGGVFWHELPYNKLKPKQEKELWLPIILNHGRRF